MIAPWFQTYQAIDVTPSPLGEGFDEPGDTNGPNDDHGPLIIQKAEGERMLGALKGKTVFRIKGNFEITDEEFLSA